MSQSYFRIFEKSSLKKPDLIFNSLSLLEDDCIQIKDNPVIEDIIRFLNDKIRNFKIIPSHIHRFSILFKNKKSKLKHKSKSKQHSTSDANLNINELPPDSVTSKVKNKLTIPEQILMKWKDKTVKFILFIFLFLFFLFYNLIYLPKIWFTVL